MKPIPDSTRQDLVKAAMMDDLGSNRLDKLPLEDRQLIGAPRGPRHSDRNLTSPFPTSMPASRSGQRGFQSDVANMWKQAVSAGTFDDEDARAVKGLDDLGGGRLHDNRSWNSATDHTTTWTKREKYDGARGPVYRKASELTPGSLLSPRLRNVSQLGVLVNDSKPIRYFDPGHARSITDSQAAASGQRLGQSSGLSVEHRALSAAPATIMPGDSTQFLQQQSHLSKENNPTPIMPQSSIFQARVRIAMNKTGDLTQGSVHLTSAPEPIVAYFYIITNFQKLCEWPLASWLDFYASGKVVTVQAGNLRSPSQYQIHFTDEATLNNFLGKVSRLVKGKRELRKDNGEPGNRSGQETSITLHTQAAGGNVVRKKNINEDGSGTMDSETRMDASEPTTVHTGASDFAKPADNLLLLDLDEETGQHSVPFVPTRNEESALALLSTLDPNSLNQASSDDSLQGLEYRGQAIDKSEMRKHLEELLNPMFELLRIAKAAGQPDADLAAKALEIKNTILDKYRLLSRKGEFFPQVPESGREEIFQEILQHPFQYTTVENSSSLTGKTSPCCTSDSPKEASTKLIKYTADELLALQYGPMPASHHLNTLEFLPPFSKAGHGQPSVQTVPARNNTFRRKDDQDSSNSNIRQPTSYAQPESIHNRDPEVEARQGTVKTKLEKKHKGLTSSRWATEKPIIRKEEAFTGPEFEKHRISSQGHN